MADNKKTMKRRSFLGTAGGALTSAIPVLNVREGLTAQSSGGKMKIALVGTGIRGSVLWGKTLRENYSDVIEYVGLCDINPLRMEFVKNYMGATCPVFTDFEEMMKKTKPDTVIVTTTDCYHAHYICRALELGCAVVTEKPMVTDEAMCQQVLDTEKKTGRKVVVTFNYRYSPDAVRIKELVSSGEIGEITSVDFNYYLDTDHGASYFRRWHAFKKFGGSLLVHKATHHFDLMNWWLGADPVELLAYGSLRKFGESGPFRSERCMTCPHKSSCAFFWDITKDEFLMNLYVKAESADGYIRDACVFRQSIDIWDTMAVQVQYNNGVMMSYSLNAGMPYEGFSVGFNGTKGRLDARIYHTQPWQVDLLADIRLTPNFKEPKSFTIPKAGGASHWGADTRMQDMIFRKGTPDPLGQSAGTRAGALSILIGVAARKSIGEKRKVTIGEMVKF